MCVWWEGVGGVVKERKEDGRKRKGCMEGEGDAKGRKSEGRCTMIFDTTRKRAKGEAEKERGRKSVCENKRYQEKKNGFPKAVCSALSAPLSLMSSALS